MASLGKRGKHLQVQSREIIFNVYKYFQTESDRFKKNEDQSVSCYFKKVQERVAEATGISRRTLNNILNEVGTETQSTEMKFSSPKKGRPKKQFCLDMDDFDYDVVRRMVDDFQLEFNELPTIKSLKAKLSDAINYNGSEKTLRRILHSMGFRYTKMEDNRKVLMEKHDKSGEEEDASAAPRKKLKSRNVRTYVGSDGSGLEEEGGSGSEEEEGEESPPSPVEIKTEQDAAPPLPVPRSQRHASTIKLRRPLRRRRVLHAGTQPAPAHHRVTDAAQLVRRAPPPPRKKDECDSFGEYIASSLRKHDERTQSMIKQAINNILFEQEMKRYNTSHYVLIDAAEENPLVDGDHHATTTTDM